MSRAEQQRRRLHRKERKQARRKPQYYSDRLGDITIERDGKPVRLLSYDITFDQILDGNDSDLTLLEIPEETRAEIFEEISVAPKSAIARLELLVEKYPGSKTLMNWLSAGYSRVGRHEDAQRVAKLNFEMHPTYLFARTNYAQLLLEQGKVEEAAALFENKWDLKLLYPDRNLFHITEFMGFGQVAVECLMRKGEEGQARLIYNNMKRLCPTHEAVVVLGRVMEGLSLLGFAKMMSQRMLGRGGLPK